MNQPMERFEKGVQYVNVISAVTKKVLTEVRDVDADFCNQTMAKFIPARGRPHACLKTCIPI